MCVCGVCLHTHNKDNYGAIQTCVFFICLQFSANNDFLEGWGVTKPPPTPISAMHATACGDVQGYKCNSTEVWKY